MPPGLAGDDEESVTQVALALDGLHGFRVSRIEYCQGPAAEGRSEHLGREARTAHTEEHDALEATTALGEAAQLARLVAHTLRQAQPAEAVRYLLGLGLPERVIVGPDAARNVGLRQRREALVEDRDQRSESCPYGRLTREYPLALGIYRFEEFLVVGLERRQTVFEELGHHSVEIHAQPRQHRQRHLRFFEAGLDG